MMAIMLSAQYQKKKIKIEDLNYWNVELQEPYYSYIEANKVREEKNK